MAISNLAYDRPYPHLDDARQGGSYRAKLVLNQPIAWHRMVNYTGQASVFVEGSTPEHDS